MNRGIGNVNLPDPRLSILLNQIKEVVETGDGQRGKDPFKRYVRIEDLVKMKLARVLTVGSNGLITPGANLVAGETPNLAVPPKPVDFDVTDGFEHVFLDWKPPQKLYSNHAYTEIWRNTVDNLATAIQIGQNTSFAFADMDVQQQITYFYWIRFVSTSSVVGPWNDTVGTPGARSMDPAELLALLESQITRTELHADLIAEIDDLTVSVNALELIYGDTFSAAESAAAAAISEANAIAAETAALAAQGGAETAQAGAQTALTSATTQATAAANSATQASSFSTSAQSAASASDSSRLQAETARDDAQGYATAAAGSAGSASSSSSDAANSASAALTSETNAASSASNAATSAGQSSTSATNAAGSESQASSYANNAANSATSAGNSAVAAAGSASTASTHATNAGNSASAASAAQVAAESARDDAQGYSTAASTSASTASTQATSSANSAAAANTSANNASSSAGSASTYASNAATSASQAQGYASAAAVDYSAVNARLNNFDGSGATVEQIMEAQGNSIDGLSAQWTVKTQVGDLIGGVGFYNNGSTTKFYVHADQFAVYSPSASSLTFAIDSGNVVMSGAYIQDGTISEAKIGTLSVSKITGLNASFITANVTTLHADKITGDVSRLVSASTNYQSFTFNSGQYRLTNSAFFTAGPYTRKPIYYYTILLDVPSSGEYAFDVVGIRDIDYSTSYTDIVPVSGTYAFSWNYGSGGLDWSSPTWTSSRPSAITTYINNFSVGQWVLIGDYLGQISAIGDVSVAPSTYRTRILFGNTRYWDTGAPGTSNHRRYSSSPVYAVDFGSHYFYSASSGVKTISGAVPDNYAFSDARALEIAYRMTSSGVDHVESRLKIAMMK